MGLKMKLTREGKALASLAVEGFPADWPPWKVVTACEERILDGTATEVERAVNEAVTAGHWPTQDDGTGKRAFRPKNT